MSQDTVITKAIFEEILDKKHAEKLKPINQMMSIMDDLKESVKFLGDKFDSTIKKVEELKVKCDANVKENKCLKMEVLRLSNIIRQHDEEINHFQQYSRRDCVEIAGLPVEPDEDTNALTIKVGSLMGIHIDEKDISISHRLPHKAQNETYSSRLRPLSYNISGGSAPISLQSSK
jgi:hypothetical protein